MANYGRVFFETTFFCGLKWKPRDTLPLSWVFPERKDEPPVFSFLLGYVDHVALAENCSASDVASRQAGGASGASHAPRGQDVGGGPGMATTWAAGRRL